MLGGCFADNVHSGGVTEDFNGHDGPGPVGNSRGDLCHIHIQTHRIDIDKDGFGCDHHYRIRGRDKSKRRRNDLVTLGNSHRFVAKEQAARAAVNGHGTFSSNVACKGIFEFAKFRTE